MQIKIHETGYDDEEGFVDELGSEDEEKVSRVVQFFLAVELPLKPNLVDHYFKLDVNIDYNKIKKRKINIKL